MKIINIVFDCGFAGRFLAELFSLSKECNAMFTNTFREQFVSSENWLAVENNRDESFLNQHKDKSKISISSQHLWKIRLTDSTTYFGITLPYTQFNNFWLVKSIELLGLQLCGYNSYRTSQFNEWLPDNKLIDIGCFLDRSTWENEYRRVCAVMEITPDIEKATELYDTWYTLRVKNCKDIFVDQDLSDKRRYTAIHGTDDWYNKLFLPYLLPEEMDRRSYERQRYINWYNSIKGDGWPDAADTVTLGDLPDNIKKELIDIYGFTQRQLRKKEPFIGPVHPMEEFSPLPLNLRFINARRK